MATIYRCDRCKEEQSFPISVLRTTGDGYGTSELCKNCIRDLIQWIKAGKKS